MITMEFEEMKQIWDSQNKETVYAINKDALYNRILSKKRQAHSITNISEWLLVIVNIAVGIFIIAMSMSRPRADIFMLVLAVWMFSSALYVVVSRVRRLKEEDRFDRTMFGDLSQAIYTATYQVRISQIMRWNILPVASLTLLGIWDGGKPVWIFILTLVFFGLAYYAGGWEHNIYKARKRELEMLKKKLTTEC